MLYIDMIQNKIIVKWLTLSLIFAVTFAHENQWQCQWDLYHCDCPYNLEETIQFKCTDDYDCPENFVCCTHRCFLHNICQPWINAENTAKPSPQNIKTKSGECDIIVTCDVPLPKAFTKAFECFEDDDCPDHYKCCFIDCYGHKVCQPAKNEDIIISFATTKTTPIALTSTQIIADIEVTTESTILSEEDIEYTTLTSPINTESITESSIFKTSSKISEATEILITETTTEPLLSATPPETTATLTTEDTTPTILPQTSEDTTTEITLKTPEIPESITNYTTSTTKLEVESEFTDTVTIPTNTKSITESSIFKTSSKISEATEILITETTTEPLLSAIPPEITVTLTTEDTTSTILPQTSEDTTTETSESITNYTTSTTKLEVESEFTDTVTIPTNTKSITESSIFKTSSKISEATEILLTEMTTEPTPPETTVTLTTEDTTSTILPQTSEDTTTEITLKTPETSQSITNYTTSTTKLEIELEFTDAVAIPTTADTEATTVNKNSEETSKLVITTPKTTEGIIKLTVSIPSNETKDPNSIEPATDVMTEDTTLVTIVEITEGTTSEDFEITTTGNDNLTVVTTKTASFETLQTETTKKTGDEITVDDTEQDGEADYNKLTSTMEEISNLSDATSVVYEETTNSKSSTKSATTTTHPIKLTTDINDIEASGDLELTGDDEDDWEEKESTGTSNTILPFQKTTSGGLKETTINTTKFEGPKEPIETDEVEASGQFEDDEIEAEEGQYTTVEEKEKNTESDDFIMVEN